MGKDDEGNSDGEDDDLLTVKRTDHAFTAGTDKNGDSNSDAESDEDRVKKDKVLTKAQIAKKLKNKKIIANTKITFGEDGEVAEGNFAMKVIVISRA